MAESTTAPQKPLRADARRNREALIEAAKDVFAEQGVDGSLEDVARRAGKGVGTLYRHFPTRDDLLRELLRASFAELAQQAADALTDDDPVAVIEAFLRELVVHARRFKGIPASVKEAMKTGETPLAIACRQTHDGWAALLLRGQEAGLVRADAQPVDVLRLVYGIAWATDSRPDDDPHLVDRMLDLVLAGLRP